MLEVNGWKEDSWWGHLSTNPPQSVTPFTLTLIWNGRASFFKTFRRLQSERRSQQKTGSGKTNSTTMMWESLGAGKDTSNICEPLHKSTIFRTEELILRCETHINAPRAHDNVSVNNNTAGCWLFCRVAPTGSHGQNGRGLLKKYSYQWKRLWVTVMKHCREFLNASEKNTTPRLGRARHSTPAVTKLIAGANVAEVWITRRLILWR